MKAKVHSLLIAGRRINGSVSLFNSISTVVDYSMPLCNRNSSQEYKDSCLFYLIIIISLHTVIWFQAFVSNTNNFEVDLFP